MSVSPEPTRPSQDVVTRDLLQEQRALTLELTSHADPMVRMVAHISERQLSLHELLSEMRKETKDGLGVLSRQFNDLSEKVQALSGRQDEVEARYNGHSLDEQVIG